MNICFIYSIVFLLTGSMGISANPAVIAEFAKFDTIFTGVYTKIDGAHACMVDRVLKGNVSPLVMAYVRLFTSDKPPVGTKCLFIAKDPPRTGFHVCVIYDGTIYYPIKGHLKSVKLKDVIDALDETPKIKPP